MDSTSTSTSGSPSPTTVADLTTERLVLRSWTAADVADVLADRRSACWASDFPAEGDRVVAGLFDQFPDWLGPYGHRQIIERASGLVVGSIGLFWPPPADAVEIGYGIVASRRARGYASEATRALAEHAFTAPGIRVVHADVEVSNPASVRVLEKAGFEACPAGTEPGTARYRLVAPDPSAA